MVREDNERPAAHGLEVCRENALLRSVAVRPEWRSHGIGRALMEYIPGESNSGLFGGNSNWRGPIWFPTSYLLIESFAKFSEAFGPEFKVKAPASGGKAITPADMAREVANRMIGMFTRDSRGHRRIYGGTEKFQHDPYWRDLILFYEYFHGDNGAGLGASHQTGWTGIIARLIHLFASHTPEQVLEIGKGTGARKDHVHSTKHEVHSTEH